MRTRGRPPIAGVFRPPCPLPEDASHHTILDGHYGRWTEAYERVRYRCVSPDGKQRHVIRPPLPARHPTPAHPYSGEACPVCEHLYQRHEGPHTGRGFLFAIQEIAEVLAQVARGGGFRQIGREIHTEALRHRVDPFRPEGEAYRRKRQQAGKPVREYSKRRKGRVWPGEVSRESRLVAAYVDAFTPIILAAYDPPDGWPDRVGLDSLPLKRRVIDPVTGKLARTGEALGEVLIAMDLTRHPTRPFLLRLAGGKDSWSWEDFLRSVPGTVPTFVVADRASEITAAVERAWPDAVLYSCEGHVLLNARDAAEADGLTQWVPREKPAKPVTAEEEEDPIRRYWLSRQRAKLPRSPLWYAMAQMQWSPERWEAFKKAVETEIADRRRRRKVRKLVEPESELRKFIANNEALVLGQYAWRQEHRGFPRSAGAAESVFEDLSASLAGRPFWNAKRLDLVLGLVRLHLLGEARPQRFAALLRAHFAAHRGASEVEWNALLDRSRMVEVSSLERLVIEARARAKANTAARAASHQAERRVQRIAAYEDQRVAAGFEPSRGRKRRTAPREYRSVKGLHVADLPDLVESWDAEQNAAAGLDPATLGAASTKVAHWICRAHEDRGHLHRWTAPIVQRGTLRTGCPFCLNRAICPSNNLAALFPNLVRDEWDFERNTLRPAEVFPGSPDEVLWRCAEAHDSYPQRISARTKSVRGCPECAKERKPAQVREGQRRSPRGRRKLAELGHEMGTIAGEEAS